MPSEPRCVFNGVTLLPARDGRGVRKGVWLLPAVRHPRTGEWYSPVIYTDELTARAARIGQKITLYTIETD